MSDTPPITNPPSRLDQIKAFIGDLARPFAIIASSGAAAGAVVICALKVNSTEAAMFIGAVFGGVALLYGAKAAENAFTSKHSADVEIAKASTAGATS